MVLHRDETRDPEMVACEQCFGKLPCPHARSSDIPDGSLADQIIQSEKCFVDCCAVIPAMNLIKVDSVSL